MVGGTGVVVNTAALYLFYEVGRWPLLVASALAVELAIVNNFLLNDQWTFSRTDLSAFELISSQLASLRTLIVGSLRLSARAARSLRRASSRSLLADLRSSKTVGRFLRFNVVSLGGLGITTFVLYILHGQGVHYLLANLAGITLATTWNFGLNVLWTWRWVE